MTGVTVAVDANGADLGAAEVAAGAAAAAAESGVRVVLFGPAAEMGPAAPGVEIVDAPLSIAKDPEPARAVRANPDASIVQAARAVAAGDADALVSGGSTGATLAAGLFNIRRRPGIHRPALALPLPIPGRGTVVLLDVGANTEVRPEHLVQFAFMGAAFSSAVLGVQQPRVGLLSNGEEPTRGTPDVIEAHRRLAEASSPLFTFAGNVEGAAVMEHAADVIVTDGFTGNVAIKLIEAVSGGIVGMLRDVARSSPRAAAGGLLMRPALRGFRDEIDPEAQGGAYVLGLKRIGVVCHGRFGHVGFQRAIERAAQAVAADVGGRTHAALAEAGALRSAPLSDSAATVPDR